MKKEVRSTYTKVRMNVKRKEIRKGKMGKVLCKLDKRESIQEGWNWMFAEQNSGIKVDRTRFLEILIAKIIVSVLD